MTPHHRVVISGIGAITPVGSGVDGLWRGVVGTDAAPPASAVRTLTRFDPTPFRSRLAAEIDDFDPLDSMDARRARRLEPGKILPGQRQSFRQLLHCVPVRTTALPALEQANGLRGEARPSSQVLLGKVD